MIVLYHSENKIIEVINQNNQKINFDGNDSIALCLQKLASQYSNQKLVWCHLGYKNSLNLDIVNTIFRQDRMMLSYNLNDAIFFDSKIGYVETSPFISVNKTMMYPTWQMSSMIGVIHASVLNEISGILNLNTGFDYYLNSVAKIAMPLGLFCYSSPQLLNHSITIKSPKANNYDLFRFVKQHYKLQWVLFLFFNLIKFEKKILLGPLFCSFFYKKRGAGKLNMSNICSQSNFSFVKNATVDVIIPTIGREGYLYDFLSDLRAQTCLPKRVIIVEQNPEKGSESRLDYLKSESWPFLITHVFTNQTGACNARNIALEYIEEEWVFFADDDIRIEPNFIAQALNQIDFLGAKAVSINCHQKGDKITLKSIFQWNGFGSGCSFVLNDNLKNCRFFIGFEFGFGEDSDFGMQLRNQGVDILYLPHPFILHLKAPIGGFRTQPTYQWHNDKIQPKPSPTIMLYQLMHQTTEQRRSYKVIFFFKYYKNQKIKNPIFYLLHFRKQWNKSLFWANQLKINN